LGCLSGVNKYSISTIMISATFLFGCEDIDRVGVGHKMVDTFEKMDAINPTFDLGRVCNVLDRVMKIRFMYFPTLTIYSGLSHLFNKRIPILTESICKRESLKKEKGAKERNRKKNASLLRLHIIRKSDFYICTL